MTDAAPARANPTFDDDTRQRLARAWIGSSTKEAFWWENPNVSRDIAEREHARIMSRLRRAETEHIVPTSGEMLARFEFEADNDPSMPPWLRRFWFVPSDRMLAMDALFETAFGVGYSAVGSGFEGERAIRSRDLWYPFRLLVIPTPGTVGGLERHQEIEDDMRSKLERIGLTGAGVTLWNETEPAKAFQGMLSGAPVREGYKRLGIAREYSPCPADPDDF